MATLTIKNVPLNLYDLLKQRAGEHHRSLNSEAIVCLENALRFKRIDPQTILARIEALQKNIPLPPLRDKMLLQAKKIGRP